jgi:hypothetical protein
MLVKFYCAFNPSLSAYRFLHFYTEHTQILAALPLYSDARRDFWGIQMKRLVTVITAALLTACGGDAGSDDPGNDNLDREQAYLNFWKDSLSAIAGEDYDASQDYRDDGALEAQPVSGASRSHSTTNVQVAGVDELDLIEFDGEVLLSLNHSYAWNYWQPPQQTRLRTFNLATLEGHEPENEDLHLELPLANYAGITTQGEYLALISHGSGAYDIWGPEDCWFCFEPSEVEIQFWQYKDEGSALAPNNIQQLSIEGSFIDARSMDGKLYLVSAFSPDVPGLQVYPSGQQQRQRNQDIINALQLDDLQPQMSLNGQVIEALDNNCQFPEQLAQSYDIPVRVSILEIDMQNPSNIRSACALGRYWGMFMSTDNLYLIERYYNPSATAILKYSLDGGPSFEASGQVAGTTNDVYHYGEVDGRLVVVNTEWEHASWWQWGNERHQLHLLEQQGSRLVSVASLPNESRPEPIGKPGELIYAVRIFGDRAYVVTFDKVDPLYVIDLSDPADPAVLGELEIPGFSAYLHPVSEDLVLGVGKNALEADGTTWFQGLNVRLFDVADPSAPRVVESLDYGLRGSETELLYDPHALAYLADPASGLARLSIPMHLAEDDGSSGFRSPWDYYPHSETGLFQFELDISNKRIVEVARNIHSRDIINRYYRSEGDRSVINGDQLYYVHGDTLDVINWGSSEVIRSFVAESLQE